MFSQSSGSCLTFTSLVTTIPSPPLHLPFTPRLVTLHSIPYETRSERGEEAKVESRWTEWVSGEGRECDETRIWGSERGKDGKNLWDEPRNTRLTAQSSSVTHRSVRSLRHSSFHSPVPFTRYSFRNEP